MIGHNLVTSFGLWRLLHPDHDPADLPSLRETEKYRMDDATALMLAERDGHWELEPERIVPTEMNLKVAAALREWGSLPVFEPRE
jgi:hypothetical protein